MYAAVIHEFGDENAFKYEETADPEFGDDDVLIRVRAASVNRGDLGRRAGTGAVLPELPFIVGWDVAGDIVEVGANVTRVRAGQRVVARLSQGGYAELAVAPAQVVVPLPNEVDYDQAASLPVVFLTAWVTLLDTGALRTGETALIQSAGSGVGMAAIQIAKQIAGARVFATAGSDAKVTKAKELGADDAINYNKQDFVVETRRLTQGRGVNVAIDGVGGDIFTRSQQTLSEGGRLISYGRTSGIAPQGDMGLAERNKQTVVTGWSLQNERTPELSAQDLARIVSLIADETLKTLINRVFPLSEVAEAHRFIAKRANFGKVVLRP